ncbi:SCP-like protein, partial [Ancylostoma duodenale]
GGYPHSVLYETGRVCKKDSDCTTYEGSKCDKSGLCVFNGTPPPPGGGPNTKCPNNVGMGDKARKAILNAHNRRRSKLARGMIRNGKKATNKNLPTSSFMPKMKYNTHATHVVVDISTYDCATEAEAIDYADRCELTKSAEKDRKGFGENVYVYPAPNADPVAAFEAAAKHWWDQIFLDGINWEVKYIQSLKDKKIDQKGFTQMAWAKSIKLGCGIQTCSTLSFIVCRYSPA